MTKLITVHGTNAGDPSDEGEHWWPRNSPFQKRLAEWLNLDGVEIEPFHWDEGPNSEVKRRKAGERLSKRLRALEKTGEDYYLIGHSHGGSVVHHALIAASADHVELRGLRSWLTIGTPFLWLKPHWLLFRRLGNIGKVGYIMRLSTLLGLPIQFLTLYFYGRALFRPQFENIDVSGLEFINQDAQSIQLLAILLTFLIVTTLIIGWSQRRMRRRYAT